MVHSYTVDAPLPPSVSFPGVLPRVQLGGLGTTAALHPDASII